MLCLYSQGVFWGVLVNHSPGDGLEPELEPEQLSRTDIERGGDWEKAYLGLRP